jgi:DNA-binding CsgD family transcriptional regulator
VILRAVLRHDEAVGERDASSGVVRSVLAARVVGRDEELAALRAHLDRAAGGNGSTVFLVGEAGIGKSRLAQVIATEAEGRGLSVLRGRAVPSPTPVAYRPLSEALCSMVRTGAMSGRAELAPFIATLGRLVPDWRSSDQERVDDSVIALAEAVVRFLRAAAADRGCVLVLEDLHWADPETVTIVEYVADNIGAERVLCIATLRDEEPADALNLARALHSRRTSMLMQLRRLDGAEVTEMVRSCLDGLDVPGAVVQLAARADGVPFLVEELLAVAVASGALVTDGARWNVSTSVEPVVPLTFADSVRRRLTALGQPSGAVLAAAAVLGRRFDWDLLPAITGLPADEVLAALHASVDAQIVSVDADGRSFRFRHALSRDAVLAELLPPERAALARRALDVLDVAQPELGEQRELAAELAEAAGDRVRAALLLLDIGVAALRNGALASAEVALDRARAISPYEHAVRADVEERLAEALALAGKRERVIEVAESLLSRLGDDVAAAARRAEVELQLARAAVAVTRWDEAQERVEHARAEAVAAADDRLLARVDAMAANAAIIRRPEQAKVLAKAALAAAERLAMPEVACQALEIIGRAERPFDLVAAEAAFTRAYSIAEERGLTVWRVRALHELGTIDLLRGRSIERLEEARELAASQGALATAAVVDLQIAATLVLGDEPERAMVPAQRALEVAKRYRLDQTAAALLAFEAHIHARAGRRDDVERCISQAFGFTLGSAEEAADIEVITAFAAAVLGFVEEDRESIREHLQRASVPASQPTGDQSSGPVGGIWALVRELDNRDPDAPDPRALEEPVHFIGRGFLCYAQAVAEGREGNRDAAPRRVAEGDHELQHSEWFRQYGHRLVAEAAIADGWGDPASLLREALAYFELRGDDQIASACRSLLRKAGVAVPRRRGDEDVPPSLRALGITGREVEVLRLVAEGLANRDISARLYLSPRTVERHIANISTKAGVQRRPALVAFAARLFGGPADAG